MQRELLGDGGVTEPRIGAALITDGECRLLRYRGNRQRQLHGCLVGLHGLAKIFIEEGYRGRHDDDRCVGARQLDIDLVLVELVTMLDVPVHGELLRFLRHAQHEGHFGVEKLFLCLLRFLCRRARAPQQQSKQSGREGLL